MVARIEHQAKGFTLVGPNLLRFFGSFLRFYCEMVSLNIDCDFTSMARDRYKTGFSRFLVGAGLYH